MLFRSNAVDLPGHASVARRPAIELDPDSDLGQHLVTVGLGALTPAEIGAALARGRDAAERLRRAGRIHAAVLVLRRIVATSGLVPDALAA